MNSTDQLDQFVALWTALQGVVLSSDSDKISWNLISNGEYSASSTYSVQFYGRIREPHLDQVWRVRAEGNAKFFMWLLLQNRNWTAERLRARNLPHDDHCCLCDQEFETAAHLALNYSFATQVWGFFRDQSPRAIMVAARSTTIAAWWKKLRRGKKDDQWKSDISLSVYIIWHVWKERGRHVFQQVSLSPLGVAGLIKADLELLMLARGSP
jgi:hypothetical protein